MYNSQEMVSRIKQLARERGILVKDLLSACDLNANTLNQISDKKGLSSFSLAKIADYLDCTVDYLLGRTENVTPKEDEKVKLAEALKDLSDEQWKELLHYVGYLRWQKAS